VLKILNDLLVEVVFPTLTGMVVMKIEKDTTYFIIMKAEPDAAETYIYQNKFRIWYMPKYSFGILPKSQIIAESQIVAEIPNSSF
jgi:hypothetical protein